MSSSAHLEEEIQQLHKLLTSVAAERDTAVARAERLHIALFETSIKAKQAIEACKRDAVEVAVEEAVREHFQVNIPHIII